MKTMKRLLIVFFLISAAQGIHAQAKTTASKKSVTPAASAKPSPQNAAVKNILPQLSIAQQIAKAQSSIAFLGTYGIYAGVQKLSIGKCTLKEDGSYTVAVNSDADNHGVGVYEFNPESKTLVWKGGLFLSNKYGGAIQQPANGKLRIQLSKSTYAEKID